MHPRVLLLRADRTGVASEISRVEGSKLVGLQASDQIASQVIPVTVQGLAGHLRSAHAHHRPRCRIRTVVQQALDDLVANAAGGVYQRRVPTVCSRVDICSRGEQQGEHLGVRTQLACKVYGSLAVLVGIVYVAVGQRKELPQHWQCNNGCRARPVCTRLAQLLADGLGRQLRQGLNDGRSIGVPPRPAGSRAHARRCGARTQRGTTFRRSLWC